MSATALVAPADVEAEDAPVDVAPLDNAPGDGPRRTATGGRAQGAMLRAIRWYQRGAEGRPSPCRFFPSCSEYGHDAIEMHGAWRGGWLTARRLLRCRPFGPSGFDPVPLPHDHGERVATPHQTTGLDPVGRSADDHPTHDPHRVDAIVDRHLAEDAR